MPRAPRTPKTGVPVAADTKRLSRVQTIRLLMSEGLWRGEASKESFRTKWKVSRDTVEDYAREASRSIRLDVADHPDELIQRVAAVTQSVLADMAQLIQDQVEFDEEKKRPVRTIGRKGKMSFQAYAQIQQTVLGAARDIASLADKHPGAFLPPDTSPDVAGPTRPPVTVVVKYADVPEDPKPPEPAPPTDPQASAPSPK